MRYQDHCRRCEQALGKDWGVVHRWMDEFARTGGTMMGTHRVYRHHREGIEEVRAKWGDEAADAAELHVFDDFGFIPTKAELEEMFGMK